jgi:LPXTG-motif cell wall-anchored protein
MKPNKPRINWFGLVANVLGGASAAAGAALMAKGATLNTILLAAGSGALLSLSGFLTPRRKSEHK